MTVGELKRKMARCKDETLVVLLIHSDDGEYLKALSTQADLVRDCMPDGEGGENIHTVGSMLLIEAHLEAIA